MTPTKRPVFQSHDSINEITKLLVERLKSELGPKLVEVADALGNAWQAPLGGDGLVSEVVLEGGFGFRKFDQPLAQLKFLATEFLDALGRAHSDYRVDASTRLPYTHQVDAWKAVNRGQSALVSAGTGSGKTECFLYPILSDLFSQRSAGWQEKGVQALFIYPTNALINSQRDRLKAWLDCQLNPRENPIRFGLYNGALPETPKLERKILTSDTCEVLSRTDLRASPPSILITNYSMLELALVRPRDQPIFKNSNLKYVVLDEAHSYQGVMAAEIAMLLRRTLMAFGVSPTDVRFVATSATFPGSSAADTRKFAADLFGIDPSQIEVIEGAREVPAIGTKGLSDSTLPNPAAISELLSNKSTIVSVGESQRLDADPEITADFHRRFVKAGLVDPTSKPPNLPAAQFIHSVIASFASLKNLRDGLGLQRSLTLSAVAELLFQSKDANAKRAAAELLDLAALGREEIGAQPFIPTRWHVAYRRIERLSVCVDKGNCDLGKAQALPNSWPLGGFHPAPIQKCGCGGTVLPLYVCQGCGELVLLAHRKEFPKPHLVLASHGEIESYYQILTHSQNGAEGYSPINSHIYDEWEEGLLPLLRRRADRPTSLKCSNCDDDFRPVGHTRQKAVAILTEGLFPKLPVFPVSDSDDLPCDGRRLIIFSDSRQVAAQLAPMIEKDLQKRALQKVLLNAFNPIPEGVRAAIAGLPPATQAELLSPYDSGPRELFALAKLMDAKPATAKQLLPSGKELRERGGALEDDNAPVPLVDLIVAEIYRRPGQLITLETLGQIEVSYHGVSELQVPASWRCFSDYEWQTLVNTMLDSARRRGAIVIPDSLQDLVNPYSFGKAMDPKSASDVPWLGTAMKKWLAAVLKEFAQPAGDEAQKQLSNDLWSSAKGIFTRCGEGFAIDYRVLRLQRLTRCFADPIVGVAFPRELKMISPENCERRLVEVTWSSDFDDLALPKCPIMLMNAVKHLQNCSAPTIRAVEHTAQIAPERLRKFEELFRNGRRNLLTSTTTMELGVDIGQLSAVMMSNAPPSPANYLQRAGRAGRRNEGSTLLVTLTSSNPHDSMLFDHPNWAFEERGPAPAVRLDRDIVVQRHANAVLLGRSALKKEDLANPLGSLGSCGSFFQGKESSPCQRLLSDLNELNSVRKESHVTDWSAVSSSIEQLLIGTSMEGRSNESVKQCHAELSKIEKGWQQTYNEIIKATESAANGGEHDLAAKLQRLKQDHEEQQLLRYLSEQQFLPRYGFPIDVIHLDTGFSQLQNKGSRVAEHQLERDLSIGLREYGPGSEVIAGGQKLKSAGLILSVRQQFADLNVNPAAVVQQEFRQCETCHYLEENPQNKVCKACDSVVTNKPRIAIRPLGFSCELKGGAPVFTRSVDVRQQLPYLPPIFSPTNEEGITWQPETNTSLEFRYARDGRILHRTDGAYNKGFDVCLYCGRAASRTSLGGRGFERAGGKHQVLRAVTKTCKGKYADKSIAENVMFIHEVKTDTLEIRSPGGHTREFATTFAFAMRDAAASFLAASPRELGAQAYQGVRTDRTMQASPHTAVLFDQVAGGAGFMQSVSVHLEKILKQALRRLKGDARHDSVCGDACPKCLLSYQTQFDIRNLKRHEVLNHFRGRVDF